MSKFHSRRAVSQVVGSLLMMAIVASVGSIVLLQGISGINDFNNILSGFTQAKRDSTAESILIEHARFMTSPMTVCSDYPCVEIWFRNTGETQSKIVSVKIMILDDGDPGQSFEQDLVMYKNDVNLDVPVKSVVSQKFSSPDLSSFNVNYKYKISAVTANGNSFTKITTTYNT